MLELENFLTVIYLSNLLLLLLNTILAGILVFREQQIKNRERKIHHAYENIINKAQTDSQKILEAAAEKAQNLIHQSDNFNKQLYSKLTHVLAKLTSKNTENLQLVFDQFLKDNSNFFNSLKNDIQNNAQEQLMEASNSGIKEVAELINYLKQRTSQVQNQVETKLQQGLAETELELKQYRQKELDKIKKELDQIVYKTVKSTLNVSLDVEQHEEIILQSLNRALDEKKFD